jgi:hypothetical protein
LSSPTPSAERALTVAAQAGAASSPEAVSPTLADVFRRYWDAYLCEHRVPKQHRKVVDAILHCRTFERGYHVDVCTHCGHTEIRPNSCRNRYCPTCQGKDRIEWVEARMHDLLPVSYYHVVFTLPEKIYPFCLSNQKVVYDLLFHSAAETLKTFGRDEQWLGAEKMGFFGVLHTWGQTLSCHPHLHFVVPAGGVDASGEWVWPRYEENDFLFPVFAVAQVFRGKFIAGLKQAYANGALAFPGDLEGFAEEEAFEEWLDQLVSKNWVVYAKAPFGGPASVVKYVSRYTHRVAISNQRILSIEDDTIRFSYKNYTKQEDCEQVEELWEEMALPAEEFMRRFLHHILPPGYHRIRYYGFLSGSQKAQLQAAWAALVFEEERKVPEVSVTPWAGMPCPACEIGLLEIVLVVNGRGQVVYSNTAAERLAAVPWERLGLKGWDTS